MSSAVYRYECAKTGRAGCQNKACKAKGDKIQKGELRFGTLVTIKEHTSWMWKHWGCVTPLQVQNILDQIGGLDGLNLDEDLDILDGYDELPDWAQAKIKNTLRDGHVADEDWKGEPELNRPGMKGINKRTPKKKASSEETGDSDAEQSPSKTAKSSKKATVKVEDEDDEPAPKKSKSSKKRKATNEDDDQIDEEALPKKKGKSKKAAIKDEDIDADQPVPVPDKKRSRSKKVGALPVPEAEAEVEAAAAAAPKPAKKRQSRKSKAKSEMIAELDDEQNFLDMDMEEEADKGRGKKSAAVPEDDQTDGLLAKEPAEAIPEEHKPKIKAGKKTTLNRKSDRAIGTRSSRRNKA